MGFSLSDLDPTSPKNDPTVSGTWTNKVGGAYATGGASLIDPKLNPLNWGKGASSPAAPSSGIDPALQAKLDSFYKSTQDLSKQYDPQRLYEEQKAPIEENFYQGANQLSSYLARQGLGSSGMNLAGHAQLEGNRSALESQAQKTATDQAIQGQVQTQLAGLAPELQKYGIDTSKIIAQMQMTEMMDMFSQQMQAQQLGGLGSLAGTLGAAAILA